MQISHFCKQMAVLVACMNNILTDGSVGLTDCIYIVISVLKMLTSVTPILGLPMAHVKCKKW